MSSFEGKHVLITGASSGIGKALAFEFARCGGHVSLLARRRDRIEEIASQLKQTYPKQKILPIVADVTSDASMREAVSNSIQKIGPLDVVLANAGFGVAGEVAELELDDFRRQFETNVFGVLRTIKETIPSLAETRGRLAIIGSVNGYVSLPGISAYAMSKFSVRALSDAVYHEMLPRGISVTHIAPGFVVSEIRRVDNEGSLAETAKDPIPMWLQMDANTASRKIVNAIYRRKRERVITAHGWWVVRLHRFFPGMISFLIQVFKIKARSEPRPQREI